MDGCSKLNRCMRVVQVIALRLNVKLSPDQERQLLESSMVPLNDEEEHVLVIETASAMPAPVVVQQLMQPPVTLGPGMCSVSDPNVIQTVSVCWRQECNAVGYAGASSKRGMTATLSGKLVIPEWAGPTGSRGTAGMTGEAVSPQRTTSAPSGPYDYQPEYFNKQTGSLKPQSSTSVSRRNSSAALLLTAATGAAGGGADSEGAGLSRPGFPISRQSSLSMLVPGGKQPSVLSSGRIRRPSLLGLPSMHVGLLHALPENDAYLGQPSASAPRRTSSLLTSSGTVTHKGSLDHEAASNASMPLVNLKAQSDFMDASLLEPEILDRSSSLPLNISRRSTSGSSEGPTGACSLQGALPPVQVICSVQDGVGFVKSCIQCQHTCLGVPLFSKNISLCGLPS